MDDTILQRRPLPTRTNTVQKNNTSKKVHEVEETIERYLINDFPSFEYSYDDVIYYTKPRGPDPFPQRNTRKFPDYRKKQNKSNRFLVWDSVVKDVDFIYNRNKLESPDRASVKHNVSAIVETRNEREEEEEEEEEEEGEKNENGISKVKDVRFKKESITMGQIFLEEQIREIDRLLKAEDKTKKEANSFISKNINLSCREELLVNACSFKMEKKSSSKQLEEMISEEQFLSEYSTAFKENARVRSLTMANEKTILDLRGSLLDHHLPLISSQMLEQLTIVNLSYNYFKSIPKQLFQMPNIVSLNMRNNPLTKISSKIKKMTKLKNLTLSFCQLKILDSSIFTLSNLERLDLSYNNLTSLHKDIDKMKSLKYLAVDGNQLEHFPRSILHMNLISLSCHSNFISSVFLKDSCPPFPQRLIDLAMVSLAKSNLLEQVPTYIREKLFDGSRCPYCDVFVSGIGVAAIKPVMELFGVNNLPILFFVCSQRCKTKLQRANELPLVNSFN